MVVLNGDPLQDIRRTRDPVHVVHRGVLAREMPLSSGALSH